MLYGFCVLLILCRTVGALDMQIRHPVPVNESVTATLSREGPNDPVAVLLLVEDLAGSGDPTPLTGEVQDLSSPETNVTFSFPNIGKFRLLAANPSNVSEIFAATHNVRVQSSGDSQSSMTAQPLPSSPKSPTSRRGLIIGLSIAAFAGVTAAIFAFILLSCRHRRKRRILDLGSSAQIAGNSDRLISIADGRALEGTSDQTFVAVPSLAAVNEEKVHVHQCREHFTSPPAGIEDRTEGEESDEVSEEKSRPPSYKSRED
ncbi:hypothetical protein DFH09DRAFT_1196777 [Mycena vulgaris]|nr:hypothetical protein DFH09DRAFT_1196777 [Mycena vulgaris]